MSLDAGRKHDLSEIAEQLKHAHTAAEREWLERLAYQIASQSTEITSLRNDLIRATNAGDTRAIERIQAHIQYIRLEETRGTSWGAQKQERKLVNG